MERPYPSEPDGFIERRKFSFALRFRADRRTLCVVASYYALVAAAYALAGRAPWPVLAAVVGATSLVDFLVAVAVHNTIHTPVFRYRAVNRAFKVALSVAYGHPASAFDPAHNLSHHRFLQTRRDMMRTTKARFRWHLLNLLFFAPSISGTLLAADVLYAWRMRKRRRKWVEQLCIEWGVLAAVTASLLALFGWKKLLLLFVLPHLFATWGIVTMNLLQHDGCDEESEYDHSRNFVGRLVNFCTLNNGFHTIHHMQPTLHWSLLPDAHERLVATKIHPELVQRSLARYLFATFVWPGRRRRHDGTPFDARRAEPRAGGARSTEEWQWARPAAAAGAE